MKRVSVIPLCLFISLSMQHYTLEDFCFNALQKKHYIISDLGQGDPRGLRNLLLMNFLGSMVSKQEEWSKEALNGPHCVCEAEAEVWIEARRSESRSGGGLNASFTFEAF